MSSRVQLHYAQLSFLVVLLCACGGGGAGGDGTLPPISDTTPPFTEANPGSGLYPDHQFVTLTSNEAATIYFTTDGNPPTVGGATTLSGPSPITNIWINHPLSLRYFAIDAANNQEFPKTSTYTFDLDRPGLFISDFLTGTYGFLEVLNLVFSSDEPVNYLVEVGGDGTPGAGLQHATGFLSTAQLASVPLPCWKLAIGNQSPGNSVWVHVSDLAGGVTSYEFLIKTMDDAAVPIGGATGELALTPDGAFAYVLRPDLDQVWKYDTAPASGTFHTLLAQIDVVANPTSMDFVADGSRLYITGDIGFSEVDVATDAVVAIPMLGGMTPSGIDIHDGVQFGLFGTTNGTYWQLDVDPGSANYRVPSALPLPSTSLQVADLVLSPDETRALVAWTSDTAYKLQVIDTDPVNSYTILAQLADAALPVVLGTPVIDDAANTGWATNDAGRIARVELGLEPPVLGLASSSLAFRGLTLSPDESVLLMTGAPLAGIRVVDPTNLAVLQFVPSGGAGAGGTGRELRFTADGKRAYTVRDAGEPTSELWMIWLTSQ